MSIERMQQYLSGAATDKLPIPGGVDNFEFASKHLGYDPLLDQARAYTDLESLLDYDSVTGWANPYGEYNIPMVRYFDEVEWDTGIGLKRESLPEQNRWRGVHHKLRPRVIAQPLGFTPTLFTKDYGIHDLDDVFDFDPRDADPRSLAEVTQFFRGYYEQGQKLMPKTLFTPWYYNLLFMWPVEILGWELFFTAAMTDASRFDELMLRFAEITKRDLTAIAAASQAGLAIVHDDLCSATGPIFRPEWYRQHILPHYNDLVAPLRQAGMKVILCIDGSLDVMLDDILSCDFDGLQVQPETDIGLVCKKLTEHGKPYLIAGLPQLEIERSSSEEIPAKLDAFVKSIPDDIRLCLQAGGLFNNVPAENIEAYFRYLGRL